VVTILTFDIDDIPQQDFLSRVCATVGVEQAQAKLGWKTCDDKKKAAYRCLATTDDVNHAFNIHRKMLDNKWREKPVYMEIVNLVSVLPVHICGLAQFLAGEAKGSRKACPKGLRDGHRS
jgi:hypothetical protein